MRNVRGFQARLSRFWALLVLGGLVALAASGCGGGATPEATESPVTTTEVTVGSSPAETSTPEAAASPEAPAVPTQTVGAIRDPFVNPLEKVGITAAQTPPPTAASPSPPPPGGAGGPGQGRPSQQRQAAVQMVAPFVVSGVLSSGGSYRAILTTKEGGQSYIVSVGDVIPAGAGGGYRVVSISPRRVVVNYGGHNLQVEMQSEFQKGTGGAASSQGAAPSGGGGGAPAPAPAPGAAPGGAAPGGAPGGGGPPAGGGPPGGGAAPGGGPGGQPPSQ